MQLVDESGLVVLEATLEEDALRVTQYKEIDVNVCVKTLAVDEDVLMMKFIADELVIKTGYDEVYFAYDHVVPSMLRNTK